MKSTSRSGLSYVLIGASFWIVIFVLTVVFSALGAPGTKAFARGVFTAFMLLGLGSSIAYVIAPVTMLRFRKFSRDSPSPIASTLTTGIDRLTRLPSKDPSDPRAIQHVRRLGFIYIGVVAVLGAAIGAILLSAGAI